MSTLTKSKAIPEPVGVNVTDDTLSVDLADGRSVSVPLAWYPRLYHGTAEERRHFELTRQGIHWPDLNEDVAVEALLNGEKSGESQRSLKKWLDYRARGQREPIPELPLPQWWDKSE